MKYVARFTPHDLLERIAVGWPLTCVFDVTPEIEVLGGAIPRADSNGTDLLHLATNAPQWVKEWDGGPFTIDVEEYRPTAKVE